MTKKEALFAFWSGFSLPAFEKNAVPTRSENGAPDFPYLTYEIKIDGFGSRVPLTASLWYRSSSLGDAEKKQEEIASYIGRDGIFLPCDGGAIWLRRGTPFARCVRGDDDDAVKRMDLNISVEFWTED